MNRPILIWLGCVCILSSCVEAPTKPAGNFNPSPSSKIALVLNEGLFQRNNSTITRYEIDSNLSFTDFFEQVNGRRLGDTGNDIAKYGDKIYIVVHGSSTIEVMKGSSFSPISVVTLFNGNQPRQPRHIAFNGQNVFVSCYDGTVAVIDTATLTITQNIQVGSYPEGLAVQNGKLYVANSGGLNFPNYDSTISIIDLSTMRETKRLSLRINPTSVVADHHRNVFVISNGNYTTLLPRLIVIDSETDSVKKTYETNVSRIAIHDSLAFVASDGGVMLIDVKNNKVLNSTFIVSSTFQLLYGISIDTVRKEIYCADAKNYVVNGEMKVFDFSGNLKRSFSTGLIPRKTIFIE